MSSNTSKSIPYFIDPSLDSIKDLIGTAMGEIEANSILKFVPFQSRHEYLSNASLFGGGSQILEITSGIGCYFSPFNCFGEQTCPPPIVTLGDGCQNHGTILHELLHSIGFPHEHHRPDRDRYIKVYRENIKEGKKDQYDILPAETFPWKVDDFPFDFSSIMMYGPTYFAEYDDRPTMKTPDGREWKVNRTNLSEIDKKKLKSLKKKAENTGVCTLN